MNTGQRFVMIAAPETKNESERLQALFDYEIMDTPEETAFDQLTELASTICDTPISLVSLVDEERQWFKSNHGLDAKETPKEYAFCSHAIHQNKIFEITDSRKDERFHDNPLVTGEPHVIFYAGAPLTTPDGHNIGTLCVIDDEPKRLSEQQKYQLEIIGKQVVAQLELRKKTRRQASLFKELMELMNETEKRNLELASFTARAAHDINSPLRQIINFSELCTNDLNDNNTEKAKEKLDFIQSSSSTLSQLVKDIFSLTRAGITSKTRDLIDFDSLLKACIKQVNQSCTDHDVTINSCITQNSEFHSQSVRLQQIIYNLINNSIKYADPEQSTQKVDISITTHPNEAVIQVIDNGLGIPEEYQNKLFSQFSRFHPNTAPGTGLGTAIVKKHIDELNGKIEFTSSSDGTEFTVTLPNIPQEKT